MSLETSAILVSLHLSKFTAKRIDRPTTAETIYRKGAAGNAGHWTTNLLPSGAMEPISKLDGEIRRFHYEHTLPWATDGDRLLPCRKFSDYGVQMRQFGRERQDRVREFGDNYSGYVSQARSILGALFDDANYPSRDRALDKFKFTWTTAPVPTAGDWRIDTSKEEIAEMEAGLSAKLKAAEEAALGDLVNRLTEPLAKMAEKLNDPDSTFRDTLVTNLRDVIKIIPDLNITGNARLQKIADAVKAEVSVFGADTLRTDTTIRATVADKVQEHLNQLQNLFPA